KIGFDREENRLGWTVANLEWIFKNPDKIARVLKDAQFIRDNFKFVIFCGMGGSGLSVQVVKDTFGEKKVKLYSLRTTDPQMIKEILKDIAGSEDNPALKAALEKTLVLAISKSGTTQETVSHKKYFEDLFNKLSLDIKKNMWVITDKGTPMDTGVYEQRDIQLNCRGDIGGRFTAPTTNVFLLPLAITVPEKLEVILKNTLEMNNVNNIEQDVFLKLGAYLYFMAAKLGKDKLTMFMPEELKDIPLWAEQLFEESLGKDGKGVTLFYGEELSPEELKPQDKNDRVFFRINIGGRVTNPDLWDFLTTNYYPVFEINVKDIYSIGGIMLGFQRSVAAIAYLWDVCFVNQPAVEGYKKGTREVMSGIKIGEEVKVPAAWKFASLNTLKLYYSPLIEAGIMKEVDIETEVKRLGFNLGNVPAVGAAIINILRSGDNFQAAELISYGRMAKGIDEILSGARHNIFTSGLKMPSKLGEGPDKNHSFHQNIEAGKNMWLSVYFMANKIEQPKVLEFDSNLLKAQAIGTVKSLVNNKRAVILVAFDGTAQGSGPDLKEFFNKTAQILNLKIK
ncbi:MAG: hypothetical protein KJ926_01495, partial [Candidatus Omnitrophica bacterium]|nr:hypothetical protein [Candidatus Omnitrophota bacterium]